MLWQRHRILAVRRPERSICSLPCSARRTVLEPGFLYTMGVNIQKLYAAVLGAMGYDNESIQEEFQAAKANAEIPEAARHRHLTSTAVI